jgi:REP element-mobilizing transposase RayT
MINEFKKEIEVIENEILYKEYKINSLNKIIQECLKDNSCTIKLETFRSSHIKDLFYIKGKLDGIYFILNSLK